jgi:hypothetical protein
MKLITRMSFIAAVALMLAGCGGGNVPAFVTSDNLTRIEKTNDQTGQKGMATKEADNLYAFLDLLHLGDITAASRVDAPDPATSVYTIVVHDALQVVWSVRVPDSPQSSRVYLNDAVHPTNNGLYPLKQPILIKDLDQFVQKSPAT